MTYGALKFRLVKAFPGVDLTLIEGWIGDVYDDILGELPWSRQNAIGVIQTVEPYATGTVTVTEGSTAVVGASTALTSAMTGRGFRVTGRDEIYEFTYASATTGTLDRAYEGDTAAGAGYKIFQHVYLLPSDCRMIEPSAFSSFPYGPLDRLDRSQLNTADPSRASYGIPTAWASYMDDASVPPRMQVEFSPIPDAVYGIPFEYVADSALPANSVAFQAWMTSGALVEGVTAKIKAHLKDYAGAAYHMSLAQKALAGMRGTEAQSMAPAQIQLPSHYTSHRRSRW